MSDPIITARGVSKFYRQGNRRLRVLQELELQVQKGEVVSVMGKSGSGKSTLLNLLSGIESSDRGTIRVAGADLTRMEERQRTLHRRKNVGMVFQFFNLIPTFTVQENIRFSLELNRMDPDGRARELMERLDIVDNRDQFPATLSGGERQRVAIARAIVHHPPVIMADEPTGNLDYRLSETVLDEFTRLCREQNVALLMATHSLECARISDRILELREGRLERMKEI